jgi:Uncharacterized protein conserved in bacteria
MKFLIDANLPRRLVNIFAERGHHAVHTLDLPDGNTTADSAILQYADEQSCVITTKDSDFTTSFWLNNRPEKLLLISTGNRFVELTREYVIVHA